MDLDTKMEMDAQGIPKQFGTTSEQTGSDHIISNVEASIANAGIPPAPEVEVKATPLSDEVPVATTNGDHTEPHVNGTQGTAPIVNEGSRAPVPEAQAPIEPEQASTEPIDNSSNATSFAESMIPSSMPAEQSSLATTEPTQAALDVVAEALPQPPTSDLRSSPHADGLIAAEVAEVEAQKHAEDNAAMDEPAPSVDVAPVVDSAPTIESSAVIAEPSPNAAPEAIKLGETGLATPPAHTPPPAPQPAPAEIPSEPPAAPEPLRPVVLPQETPIEPTPTPAEPTPATEMPEDEIMTDAPPAKVAREREDDQSESEPSAKRLKTDELDSSFKVPDVPAATSSSPAVGTPARESEGPADEDDTVTAPRVTHMKKVISNLKKSNASTAFRQPVDPVALNIPTYPEIVKNPMDLGKIDQKLKNNAYNHVSEFRADFGLIVSNCMAFNGPEHGVTQQALKMQASFNNQMKQLPKAQYSEPTKEEKRAARPKQEPTRQAPPRRPSVTTAPAPVPRASAQSPKSAVTATTPSFAPGPDGMPLIRRDSNMADGRPKRQIVPPKRNQEFAGGRPKKKKYELELRFCQEVLKELIAPAKWHINQYFTYPVDPVALNIPTYFQIVKKPMDLGTVQNKLENNVYEKAKDFEEDVRLVFKNCYKFNPEGDWVNQAGHQLEKIFDERWAKKDEWIASKEPQSEPQSDAEDEDSDAESEDDADDSEGERNDKIALLQKQIAEMSKQMGELTQSKSGKKKKSKSPNAPSSKKNKTKSKKEKPKTTFPGLQKPEKKKSISKPKPEKEKFVSFQEKQYISNGIAMLPEKQMSEALRIIQQSVPALANSNESEIELDIEEVPNHALIKLLNFVKKYAGPPPEETKAEESYVAPAAAPQKSKKNKPMSKAQQEAQIDELRGKLNAYAGGPGSPGAMQSIENDDDSSGDNDSEESEED